MDKHYVITNIGTDSRQFWDSYLGRTVILLPGESTFAKSSPAENEVFLIEKSKTEGFKSETEQPAEKKVKKKKKGDDE